MTIDPQVLRAEQHLEIGRALQSHAAATDRQLVARAAQEQPHADRLHEQNPRDQLPQFLQALGRCLAESTTADTGPHCLPAAEHGEQRWEAGWSLTEVVRDYQILRLVLFEDLETLLQQPLVRHEVQAIGLALDEAIAASVAAYVRHRDAGYQALEQDLRKQAEELREVDRRKNEFLAVLAHEMRNPMAPILHAVEVLKLLGPADVNVAQARDIVERQVRQMVRLVDDLADLTRIAQGKIELRRTSFDLAAAAAEAIQTTAPLLETQEHQLAVSLPTEPLRMEGDQARIVQVLVNLLNNAAKYTDRGGRLRLTAAREGGEVVLTVGDNGVGIEPEMLGRVFDLFMQIDRSRPLSRGGLGIGLTLVRQLVELHGGRVAVHSDGAGRGSEFTVRLPAAAPPADHPTPADSDPPVSTPLDILIIEDNADAADAATAADVAGPSCRGGFRRRAWGRDGARRTAERGAGGPGFAGAGRTGGGAATAGRPGGVGAAGRADGPRLGGRSPRRPGGRLRRPPGQTRESGLAQGAVGRGGAAK